jgi:acetyl esterase/lipase
MIERNIPYTKVRDQKNERRCLDVFYEDKEIRKPVMIFLHGGSWSEGNKNLYTPLGHILTEKGLVGVIINYRLAPSVDFAAMAGDCAAAVKWVYEHIEEYGGDPDKIFLLGHSAGGHLSALITLNEEFFEALDIANPVKGCLLLDAFGLNIHTFLSQFNTPYNYLLHKVFSDDPVNWLKGAPEAHLDKNNIPFLIWIGGNTYPYLHADNLMFAEKLKAAGRPVACRDVKGKTHYQMVTQLEKRENPLYEEMLDFISGKLSLSAKDVSCNFT